MKASYTYACCAVFFSLVSVSQAQRSINIHDHLLIRDSEKYLHGDPKEVYEGSPYLDDTFVTGYVYLGSEKFIGVPMRYNISGDVMEFKDGASTYVLEPDHRITKIELDKQVFIVADLEVARKQNGFLELLESGKLTLLARKAVNYRKKNDLQGVPAKYARLPDTYYYKVNDQSLIKVGSLKNLIGSLPDKQREVTEFVKAEHISAKTEHDLVRLAKFYNSLFVGN